MVSVTHTGSEEDLDKDIAAWSHCEKCIKA